MVDWESISEIGKVEQETQRGHMLRVAAEKNRPIFTEDGEQKRGTPRITMSLRRNKMALFLSVPEAQIIYDALGQLLPTVEEAHQQCEQERRAHQEQQWHTPGGHEGGMRSTGKTARQRAKGKAGAAAHRGRKMDKSEESRRIRNEMRSSSGKKK